MVTDSRPLTVKPKALVILSVEEVPESVVKATVGAATAVSKVKPKEVEETEELPATSVWRTTIVLAPSPVKVTAVPEPAFQVTPPFVLYVQVAPASKPVRLTVPVLV